MGKQHSSPLRRAFDTAMAPARFVYQKARKHIGYESAMTGWTNEEPMSGPSRKSQKLRDAFSKQTRKGPIAAIDPASWLEFASDARKALAPTEKSRLLPKFEYSNFEEDMKRFKPNPRLKQRLQESTAMDTSRSLMRSSMKILGMYWTKAGLKEVSIAGVLAVATAYCTLKSVDVQATFSYWGRDFNDFLVQAFGTSGEIQQGIFSSMKEAYDININDSTLTLLQTVITQSEYNFDGMDVTTALENVRLSEDLVGQIIESINSQFGDLELERFVGGEHQETLENMIRSLDIPPQHMDAVVEQVTNAVITQADVKHASQELIGRVSEQFGTLDPGMLTTLDAAMNEFSVLQSQMGQLGITFEHNFTLPQILEQEGPDAVMDAILNGLAGFDADALDPEEIGPARIEFLRDFHAQLQADITASQAATLHMLERAQQGQTIMDDLEMLMATDIFGTARVSENLQTLTTEKPRGFLSLLGQFLIYALPAAYTAMHLALRWKTWMTGKLTNEWNKYSAAYKLRFEHSNIDNPDQRISENLGQITDFATDFTTDGMQNFLTLMAFIPILNAMGDFNPSLIGGPDIMIENFMTWSAFTWGATAAAAMAAISYTLPRLNREKQHASGDLRAGLISVRSQPEQISLAKGEKFEKGVLSKFHWREVAVDISLINKRMQIMLFNSIEGNLSNYVPYIATVPLGMAATLTFGQAMQAAGIFRTVDRAIDFVKRTIPQFAVVKANIDRTAQLIDGIELAKYEMLEKEYYRRIQDGEMKPPRDDGSEPLPAPGM